MKLRITTSPKCTRSMPRLLAAGSSTGTNTSSITAPSSTVPRTRNITLTASWNPSGEALRPAFAFECEVHDEGRYDQHHHHGRLAGRQREHRIERLRPEIAVDA